MEEQKVSQKENKDSTGCIVWFFAIPLLLTIIGTVLGAINFINPVTYPPLILVLWLLSCLFVLVFMAAHLILYIFFVPVNEVAAHEMTNRDIAAVVFGFLTIALLIAGGIIIATKHFGVFSGLAFLVVFIMLCVDLALWFKEK